MLRMQRELNTSNLILFRVLPFKARNDNMFQKFVGGQAPPGYTYAAHTICKFVEIDHAESWKILYKQPSIFFQELKTTPLA